MSDKKQEVLSHWEHSGIWRCVCVVHCFSFLCCVFVLCLVNTDVSVSWVHSQVLCIEVCGVHFVLLFVLTFFILRCDARCDFCTNAMLGTSFPPVVCKKTHVLFILFMFAPWCDIPLYLSMNRMFCTSLAPLDCRRAHVLFRLFVFICCLIGFRMVSCLPNIFSVYGLSVPDWLSLTFIG